MTAFSTRRGVLDDDERLGGGGGICSPSRSKLSSSLSRKKNRNRQVHQSNFLAKNNSSAERHELNIILN